MANTINNLRVNNKEVKKIYFNDVILKEFYYNNLLIWKNANPAIFTNSIFSIDLTALSSDTIIFEGFSVEDFESTYVTTENIETDKPTEVGQIVVETTEGD